MTTTISPENFRKASGLWATGVSIVTTIDGSGAPFGLTMNSVTSLSLNPPLYLVNLDNGSDTLTALMESRAFCINVLASDQQALSNKFAKKGGDKFTDVAFSAGATGAPRLDGALMCIDCRINAIHAGGDHQIVVGDVVEITTADPDSGTEPLLFYCGAYGCVTLG